MASQIFTFIGSPTIAVAIGLILAIYTLAGNESRENVLNQMEEAPMERTVNITDLTETTVYQLKLQKPSDDAVLLNDTVTVTVEIGEIVDYVDEEAEDEASEEKQSEEQGEEMSADTPTPDGQP